MSTLIFKRFNIHNLSINLYIYMDDHQHPWFKSSEIAAFLGLMERDLVHYVDANEKKHWGAISLFTFDAVTWQPEAVFVNESGLFSLMLHSRMPYVRHFQRWVVQDVMPFTRQSGGVVSDNIKRMLDLLEKKDRRIFDMHADMVDVVKLNTESVLRMVDILPTLTADMSSLTDDANEDVVV